MKRDMDLVREILLALERDEADFTPSRSMSFPEYSRETIAHHLKLTESAGFIKAITETMWSDAASREYERTKGWQLTWDGHEFLETIRDPEIWRKTKDGANKVGGWTVNLLAELGKGYLKAKAIELGLPIA